ncbi:MAG TPA: SGNH/GDSL hydrolase family protein [Niallia sp.]|nr:SGNH/GDSL hydrolase family protein [Niallia sp.]
MKKTFTFLILILSFIWLTACTNPTFYNNKEKDSGISIKKDIPITFIPQDYSFVSIGDSLTQGVGDSSGKGGYVPILKKLLEDTDGVNKANFTNYGVRGNRSDQLLTKIKTAEVQKSLSEADGVIITIGGNDIMKVVRNNITDLQVDDFDKQLTKYEKNLKSVLQSIKRQNDDAYIILIGVYNPFLKVFSDIKELNDIVTTWNQTSEKVLSQFDNTSFVSITDIFDNPTEDLLYEDYFHPNDQGYKLIAKAIYEKMDNDILKIMEENKNRGE